MTEANPYQEMAKLLGAAESKIIPQILRMIADEKEIQILKAAFPPATARELAAQTGFSEPEVESAVPTMFFKGLLFHSKKEGATRAFLDLW